MSNNLVISASSASPISDDLELRVIFHPKERPSCGRAVMAGLAGEEESSGQAKTIQYTWRGLRMVGEPSLFDLEEAVWHPDEKVSTIACLKFIW